MLYSGSSGGAPSSPVSVGIGIFPESASPPAGVGVGVGVPPPVVMHPLNAVMAIMPIKIIAINFQFIYPTSGSAGSSGMSGMGVSVPARMHLSSA